MSRRAAWWLAAAASIFFVAGVTLSRRVEPGVRVEAMTLAGDTPALEFLREGPGPHPVALLAHGFTGSKEQCFRFGEALAAAGFRCIAVDLPGHGGRRGGFPSTEMPPRWKRSHARSGGWMSSWVSPWVWSQEPTRCGMEA